MTNEIALHCMKAYSEYHNEVCEECPVYGETGTDHCFEDALNMAIKALETIPKYKDAYNNGWDDGAKATYEHLKMCEEEQETSGDLISRDAVIDITWEEPSYTDALNVLTEVRDKVKALPSVNPKEKTGHWIPHANGIWIEYYECSKCGKVHDTQSDYCEKCGIRMESEDEG